MNKNTGHLISRFKWQTSFDNKEKGFEVQERLSAWSQNFMPHTVMEVFDKMCPSEQVWRIPSLEVDLGIINLDNMEAEMALQLQTKLQELLSDMILYPAGNNTQLDIYHENTSYLQLIATFLQHGFLPWTHKTEDGSINQIVASQLQNNRYETIKKFRELGVTHENVRKRMAWQLNEENIITIIEGLEPSYHKEIIDFSGELNKIQQKEIIVQADARDFKKHVWFWILNYLLTENGSVFNKVAFAKSSIMQMALHYNITYEALLDLIMKAIKTVGKNNTIKSNFIIILTMLSEEHTVKKQVKTTALQEPDTDYWSVLEAQLNNLTALKSEDEQKAFNDLLVKLERQDKQRLKQLINAASEKDIQWLLAYKNLNTATLETVLGLYTDASHTITQTLELIEKLCQELNIDIGKEELSIIGVQILTAHNHKTLSQKEFFNAILAELSKIKKTDINTLLIQFARAKTIKAERNAYALQTYNYIMESLSEKEIEQHLLKIEDIEEAALLINNLHLPIIITEKARLIALKKVLIESITIQPEKTLDIIRAYPNQEKFLEWLPQLLDVNTTFRLIQNTNKKAAEGIIAIQRIAAVVAKEKKYAALAKLAETHLSILGLQLLIEQKTFNPVAFITELLKRFYNALPQSQHAGFGSLLQRLYRERIIPESALQTLTSKNIVIVTQSPLEQVLDLISINTSNKTEIVKILKVNSIDREIVKLKKQDSKQSKTVINYLLQGGASLLDKLVKEYAVLLSHYLKNKTENRLKEELIALYWECLLDYTSHRGNTNAFTNNFKQAVTVRYPVKKQITATASRQFLSKSGEKGLALKDGTILSQDMITAILEKGLLSGSKTVMHEGKRFDFEELLEIAIVWFPADLRTILSSTVISRKSVDLLIQTTDFVQFSHLILQDKPGSAQKTLETIISLYRLFASVTSGTLSEKITQLYWAASWKLFIDSSVTNSELKKLVNDSLLLIGAELTDLKERIAIAVNKGNIAILPEARQILLHHVTLPKSSIKGSVIKINGILLKYRRKGLLYDLVYAIVMHKQLPVALGSTSSEDVKTILNELVIQYPHVFLSILKREFVPETQMRWLNESIDFRGLIKSISYLNRNQESNLIMLQQLYYGMVNITLNGVSTKTLQELLFRKLIKVWTSGNWKLISAGNIWNELIWECSTKLGVPAQVFIQQLSTNLSWLPPALRVSFRQIQQQYTAQVSKPNNVKVEDKPKPIIENVLSLEDKTADREMIAVKNAGMVLLNSYTLMYFERLGLIKDRRFIDTAKQDEAVHYLQYLATGIAETEEYLLPLNKVLCGLALYEPVSAGITVPDEHKKLTTGLLQSAINYWNAIGESSINGFRGNWLVRDGLLCEEEERWELTVEKRPYDLLIHKSPFSFSIIKHPWMAKPLHVNWNY